MTNQNDATKVSDANGILKRWVFLFIIAGCFMAWGAWKLVTVQTPQSATASHAETKPPDNTPTAHDHSGHGMHQMPKPANTIIEPPKKQWYRCTMPECNDPGSDDPNSRCPVCGMKRETVETDSSGDSDDVSVKLGDRARKLAEIETTPVEYRVLHHTVRTVGVVSLDETRHKVVSAWNDGRIDRLFADFTGMLVQQGDHLAELYSPELLSAQEEYLQARNAQEKIPPNAPQSTKGQTQRLLQAARQKLELLGATPDQIDTLDKEGKARIRLVAHAPIGGTIMDKFVREGQYVKTGDPMFEIADLSHLWLMLDVYETDLPWLSPFQSVHVTSDAFPGEVFKGTIGFVDPVVNPQSRTIAVRVNVPNPDLRLKPDMYVTAEIKSTLGSDGKVAEPLPPGSLACPMHPWITSNTPADCSICGMDLVDAKTIPDFPAGSTAAPVLSVSKPSVLQTGQRALAYVEKETGVYEPRHIRIGPLSENDEGLEYYPVLDGLREGEHVVTRGNFIIDSQMQIEGKPSLLFPVANQQIDTGHQHHVETKPVEQQPEEHTRVLPDSKPESKEQAICPVMGNEIVKNVYTDYHGVRVYFCCPPCIKKFNDDPDKYMPKLPEHIQKQIKAAMAKHAVEEKTVKIESQTICPVMGNEIVKDVYTDYHGVRIYFCCPPCIKKFNDDPDKYIPKLPEHIQNQIKAAIAKHAENEKPEKTEPQTICPVMGNEIVNDVYTDYRGVRVYFCCPPCIKKFNDDPEKYIPKLPEGIQKQIRKSKDK